MQLRGLAITLLSGGVLASLVACTEVNPFQTPANSPQASVTARVSSPTPDQEDRPPTRIMPISIEGQITETELSLLDQPSLPFTTYFPSKDFKPAPLSSPEGTGVRLAFNPRGGKGSRAYLDLFMPSQAMSLDNIHDLLLGEQGLFARNSWELVDRTEVVSYPWAKEKLIYQERKGNETIVGSIYIGEYQDQAFYTLTHYPAEYGDGFEPRSTIVLENMQFRGEE